MFIIKSKKARKCLFEGKIIRMFIIRTKSTYKIFKEKIKTLKGNRLSIKYL